MKQTVSNNKQTVKETQKASSKIQLIAYKSCICTLCMKELYATNWYQNSTKIVIEFNRRFNKLAFGHILINQFMLS